jgi:hypothetical protein
LNSTKLTLVAALALALGAIANAQTFTFDSAVTLSPTQAAGTWYTDRYAPAGFTSPVSFMGDNRLRQSISSADSSTNRPASFSGAFYNTQGRKYDLNPFVDTMSIELFIPSAWGTNGFRNAGFWGTGVDNSNATTAFPIIEFASNSDEATGGRLRALDGAGWQSMGLPTGFAYDQFYKLNITLAGGQFNYSVGDASLSVSANGTTSIANVILQGHNTTAGRDYDIHWDNLQAVPEPASMAAIGLGILGLARRRKANKA